MDGLGAETAPTHAFEIHAARLGRIAEHGDERRHVLADGSAHAGEAVGTDMAILMDQRIARQDRPVAHVHVSRQRGVVDQDAVIGDHAVVTDMGIGHDQVVVTDGGLGAVLNGAAVNGHTLANHIVIADDQSRRFALVLEIRGVLADRRELVDAVVATDTGRPLDDHM